MKRTLKRRTQDYPLTIEVEELLDNLTINEFENFK